MKLLNESIECYIKKLGMGVACGLVSTCLYANPVLQGVASGNVNINQTATTTTVNQTSQKAIINWQSFNIGQNESTHFQQPAGGIALNRVNPSQGPSSVYGRLTATGQIILVNPAGIFFGPSAYVNVGGIIASTADLSDQNFLNGMYKFQSVPGYNGSVVNQGTIIAINHGLVALLGNGVRNDGYIEATLGQVVLASGSAFTMNFNGNNLISFSVDGKALEGVKNEGHISANGGRILVTAKAAAGVLDNVINMKGILEARSIAEKDGSIIISGDEDAGTIEFGGEIYATGIRGGLVSITGFNILLSAQSMIDVSGTTSGGQVMIGGGFQGQGPLPHANAVVMETGATILADATQNGNGGQVVLWSDYVTKAHGSISAKGGTVAGNGGLVETSSKQYLEVAGISVNTLAANGKTGLWLLDPTDVTITAGADTNATFGGGVYQPTDGSLNTSNIDVTNLVSQLNTTDVMVTTTPLAGAGGAGNGDITVNAAISWTGATTLTLDALNDIIINQAITASAGNLILTAGNNINIANTLNIDGTVTLTSDSITFGANVSSGLDQTYNSTTAVNLSANTQLTSSAGAVIINNNASGLTAAGFDLTINVAFDSTIGLVINSLDNLIKDGVGNLSLTEVNLYTGTTTLNDGSLTIGNNNALGADTATVVLNGGSLILASGTLALEQDMTINAGSSIIDENLLGANAFNGDIDFVASGAGTVTIYVNDSFFSGSTLSFNGLLTSSNILTLDKTGNSVLSMTGSANTFFGTINLDAGSLAISSDQGYGSADISVDTGATVIVTGSNVNNGNDINFANGSFLIDGSLAGANNLGGILTIADTLDITVSDANAELGLNGPIVGTNITINKLGNGQVTIGGFSVNTPSGDFNVTNGILEIAKADALGTMDIFVTGDAALVFNVTGTLLFSNNISLNSTGISGQVLIDNGTNATTIVSGLVTLGADDMIIYVNDVDTSLSLNGGITDGGSGFSFSKDGLGTLSLQVPNTFGNASNGLTVTQGIVIAGNSQALGVSTAPTLVVSGAQLWIQGTFLDIANPITINGTGISSTGALRDSGLNTISGNVIFGSNGATINTALSTDHIIFTGVISDGGNAYDLTKIGDGSITLMNTNTYTGATLINDGTLTLGSNTALGTALVHTSSVTVANGATIRLDDIVLTPTLALSVSGTGTSTEGAITGSGNSTWNGDITLIGNTSISSLFSTDNFTFNGAFDGAFTLTLDSPGTIIFAGTVGNTVALAGLTANSRVAVNGGIVTTTGAQTYNDDVTMNANTTFTATGNSAISFQQTLNSFNATPRNLSIVTGGTGAITLDGNVGDNNALGSVTLDSSGTTTIGGTLAADSLTFVSRVGANTVIDGTNITTTGASGQTYNNNVALSVSSTLISNSGAITFAGIVSGLLNTLNLQSISSTGAVSFNGNVSLAGLTTAAGNYAVSLLGSINSITTAVTFANTGGVTLGNGGVDTSTFNGLTSTASTTTLNSTVNTTNDNITFGTVVLAGNSVVDAGTGSVSYGGITGAFSLDTVSSTGVTYNGNVNIASLISGSGGGTDTLNAASMTTTGTQTYNNAITLGSNVTFTTTDSTLTFGSTIDGNFNLTAAAGTGAVNFNDVISFTTALQNLSSTGSGTVTFADDVGANGNRLTTVAITGNTILSGSVITTSNVTFSGNLTLAADSVVNNTGGLMTITGAFNGGGFNFTFNSGGNGTIDGNISNLASLLKLGGGTLAITSPNNSSYSGTTTITSGAISIGVATNALGSGNLVLNGGDLQSSLTATLANNFSLTASSSITGSNALTLSGTGTLTTGTLTVTNSGLTTLSGNLSGAGNFTVNNGNVILSGNNTYTGATTLTAGALAINSDEGLGSIVTHTSGVSVASGTLTLNAVNIAGAIPLTLNGATALASTGTSSYAGDINLNTSSGVSVTGTLTLSGAISGTGAITKNGSGTLIFSNTGNNYSGATNITTGTLQLAASNVIPNASVTTVGGTLDLNDFNETIDSISGSGSILLGTATLTTGTTTNSSFSGSISESGNLVKQGSGTFTLAGSNTYTGTTTINAGTLSITNDNGLGSGITFTSSINVTGSTILELQGVTIAPNIPLTLTGSLVSTGTSSYAGGVTLGASSAVDVTGTLTLSGVVGGTVLSKNGTGTLILSNSGNNYSGNTNLNVGTLQITANNAVPLSNVIMAGSTVFDLNGFDDSILSLAGSGSVLLGGGTLTVNNTSDTTFSGVISEAGNLIKNGANAFVLGGANTFTGNVTINAGTLRVGILNALPTTVAVSLADVATAIFDLNNISTTIGSLTGGGATGGNVTLGSATLTIDSNATTTYAGVISGTGGLTLLGGTSLTLSGTNTYQGATLISVGTLLLGASNAIDNASAVTVSGGSNFNLNGFSDTILSLAGAGNVILTTGTLTTGSTGNTTFSGIMSGNGNLVKQGSGTFTLSGSNTFTGTTSVTAGTLEVSNNSALGSGVTFTSGVTVDALAFLQLTGATITPNIPLALNGTLASTGTSSYAGGVTLGAASAVNQAGTLTLSGILSGSALTVNGSGTLILSNGSNAYTGDTNLNAGTLQITATNAVPVSNVVMASGSTFDLNGFNDSILSLAGTGSVFLGGGTLTVNNTSDTTFNGVISEAGNLIKNGANAFVLGGVNTFTGTTTINAGTLRIGILNALPTTAAITLADVATAVFDLNGFSTTIGSLSGGGATGGNITLGNGTLTVNNSANTTYAGAISGNGGLTKQGTGTLTLSGTNSYLGATSITAGILSIDSATAINGTSGITVASSSALNLANVAIVTAIPLSLSGTGIASGGALVTTGTSSYTGAITLLADSSINATGTLALTGNIGGTFGLASVGTGTLTLSGTNTYQGATSISNGGVLVAASAQALGDSGTGTTVSSSGTLRLAAIGIVEPITLNNGTLESTGVASLTGNLTLATSTSNFITANIGSTFTMLGSVNGAGALTFQGAGSVALTGNIGDSTRLTTLTVSANSTINAAQIQTTGNQTFNNAIVLGSNATFDSQSANVLFNSTVDGAFDLNVIGGTGVTFTGIVGATPLNSLTVNAGTITISGGSVTSVGNQAYTGTVSLGATTTLTSNNADISFSGSVIGGQDLNLIGGGAGSHNFVLPTTLALNNLVITATVGSTNNALTVAAGGTHSWNISGTDTGSLTGVTGVSGTFGFSNIGNLTGGGTADNFTLNGGTVSGSINGGGGSNNLIGDNVVNNWTITGGNAGTVTGVGGGFTNIQTLTGGNANNTFTFFDGGSVTTVDGGSLANTNILDYSNITAPVTVVLATTFTGSTSTNSYLNINQLNGDYANDEIDISAKDFVVVETGFREGYIDDPIFYFGYLVSGSAPVPPTPPPVPPEPPFIDVAPIIQQPIINHEATQSPTLPGDTDWSYDPVTTDNLADIIDQFGEEYNDTINDTIINPTCYSIAI